MAENEEMKAVETPAVEAGNKPSKNVKGNGKFNRNGNKEKGGRRFNSRPQPEYEEKVIRISKVTKVVKGGKRMKFTALTVIGDKKGKYGYGLGKSGEVPEAIKKSLNAANRNMFKVQLSKGDTIAHTVMGHFGATQVFLKPAPEGTGLVAGGAVRAILELAGVRNVYSKIYGSRTQTNVVKATVDALKQLKSYDSVKKTRYNKVDAVEEK